MQEKGLFFRGIVMGAHGKSMEMCVGHKEEAEI